MPSRPVFLWGGRGRGGGRNGGRGGGRGEVQVGPVFFVGGCRGGGRAGVQGRGQGQGAGAGCRELARGLSLPPSLSLSCTLSL
jgi:hypothetical protein